MCGDMRFKSGCCYGGEKKDGMKVARRSRDTALPSGSGEWRVRENNGTTESATGGAVCWKTRFQFEQKKKALREEGDYVGDFADI